MKTNLFLLAVIVVGGWYLWNMGQPAPEAAPVPAVSERSYRPDYSQARTYYSPLNDPAVPASTNYRSNNGYPGSGGYSSGGSLGLGAGNPVGPNSYTSQPGVSLGGSRLPNYTSANGEPTLNIQRRASNIGDAARGE